MEFGSLLWLENSIKQKINPSVIKDLGLERVYEKLIQMSEENEAIVYELCLDSETIVYRQGILSDLINSKDLLDELMKDLEGFLDLKSKLYRTYQGGTHFYTLINLVVMVEASITCLEALHGTLSYYKVHSQGLMALKNKIDAVVEDATFKAMKQDLKEIRFILSGIKSVELSINMTVGMRPTDAQVTEVNEYPYRYPKAFRKVSDALEQNKAFLGRYMKSYSPIFGVGRMDWDILDELEHAFKGHKTAIRNFLNQYENLDVTPFIALLKEITFYQASCGVLNGLRTYDMPLCVPTLLNMDARQMKLLGLYNLNTAQDQKGVGIVLNDFTMDEEGRIFILTGANMGGKTTVTQGIGQIQVLAQLGLLVPAKQATLSLVDQIFTHFPVQEKDTVTMGRLGKECQMFSALFKRATDKSLMLLNEPFTGTSYLESLKISEEAIRALKYKKVRTIMNTHLHELYEVTKVNSTGEADDTPIISLVVGREGNNTSFKIERGAPLGTSYAREIAKKQGVTFEQLTRRLGGESNASRTGL